jgi:hypothetical protein
MMMMMMMMMMVTSDVVLRKQKNISSFQSSKKRKTKSKTRSQSNNDDDGLNIDDLDLDLDAADEPSTGSGSDELRTMQRQRAQAERKRKIQKRIQDRCKTNKRRAQPLVSDDSDDNHLQDMSNTPVDIITATGDCLEMRLSAYSPSFLASSASNEFGILWVSTSALAELVDCSMAEQKIQDIYTVLSNASP